MKINQMSQCKPQRTKQQETPKTPKRSFREVMTETASSRKSKKQNSLFDLAMQEEEKKGSKKQEEVSHILYGDMSPSVALASIEHGSEPVEINLPNDLIALIDTITDCIAIETQQGITTTTFTLDMEQSIFNGCQITLEHYDTAPHSFNLQLSGTPEGVDLFKAHLASLQIAFLSHTALQDIDVRVLFPILKDTSKPVCKSQMQKKRQLKQGKESKNQKMAF